MLDQLQQDLKSAMLQKDAVAVATLRMLISELKNAAIAKADQLTDEEAVAVVLREVKKRREAAEGFRKGNREDAAANEEAELKVLEQYLPAQLSDEELEKVVEQMIQTTGASSMADMGKVIGAVKAKVGQSAEGSRVSAVVKAHLSK